MCQNGGTCVDLQRCICPDNFTGKHTPAQCHGSGADDVTTQGSDDVVCVGSFCEKSVCLKNSCLDKAKGSSSSLTSHLYLLTFSLMSSTVC